MKTKLIFEMETSDPDDFLTLCWLADHPQVDLQAVVVTPGTVSQCRLVRWGLDQCGAKTVPLGAFDIAREKECVSVWHYKVFGDEIKKYDPGLIQYGPELVGQLLRDPQAGITYLVGSAPKNIGQAFRHFGELRLERWVQQGFFAGDNLVEHPLEKFKGRFTCPSFNPNGDPKSALELLASDRIRRKLAVSKNVCHGVRWTPAVREKFNALTAERFPRTETFDDEAARLAGTWRSSLPTMRKGLQFMVHGFDVYLHNGAQPDSNIPWEMESEKQGQGKAMHDLVAAVVCLDEAACAFKEVDVYRERGEWGARAKVGTRTWISVAHDAERFIDVLAR